MDGKILQRVTCIVINGSGEVGKDTLIRSLITYPLRGENNQVNTCLGKSAAGDYIYNISSVDQVKAAAEILGWNSKYKTSADRQFLHDLKECSIRYNDGPTCYIMSLLTKLEEECLASDMFAVVFVHIREPDEIYKLRRAVSSNLAYTKFRSLLVKDVSTVNTYENGADDVVDNYYYNYTFVYDKSNALFEETSQRFDHTIRHLIVDNNV